MSTQDEYRRYASECVESAKTASNEAVRKQFLNLAKVWMTAAQKMGDGISVPLAPKESINDNHH